jgi:DNA-binding CsgD family transcriptional regulator
VARYVLRMAQANDGERAGRSMPAMPERVPALTKREIEILEIIGRGFSSAETGEMLGLSVHTVIAHTRNIHRKLEVSSRSAAIFEALSRGLIRLD